MERYTVITDGYWSFIIDTTMNKVISHGYDLICDAELEADRMNNEVEDNLSCLCYVVVDCNL